MTFPRLDSTKLDTSIYTRNYSVFFRELKSLSLLSKNQLEGLIHHFGLQAQNIKNLYLHNKRVWSFLRTKQNKNTPKKNNIKKNVKNTTTYPGRGPPLVSSKTWCGFSSFLKLCSRSRPFRPPLFGFTNTRRGQQFCGILEAWMKKRKD